MTETERMLVDEIDRRRKAVGMRETLYDAVGTFLAAGIQKAEGTYVPGQLAVEYEALVDAYLATQPALDAVRQGPC